MPKIKGGKDGTNYIATFDGKSESKKFKKTDMDPKDCIILVSVQGNKYCTEKWFDGTLKCAIKKFSRITLLIVDGLNEYNLKSNLKSYENDFTNNKYRDQAIILGLNWFTKNLPSFLCLLTDYQKNKILATNYLSEEKSDNEKIKIFYKLVALLNQFLEKNGRKFEIFTWNQWISGEESNLLKINNHILGVKPIYEAVSKTASKYVKRHFKGILDLSRLYLVGETVGLIYLAMKRKYGVICYPGDCPKPFEEFIHYINKSTEKLPNFLKELQNTSLDWLHINFENIAKHKKNSILERNQRIISDSTQSESPDLVLKEICDNLIKLGFSPEIVGQSLLSLSQSFLTTQKTGKNSAQYPKFFPAKRENNTERHFKIGNTCIAAK